MTRRILLLLLATLLLVATLGGVAHAALVGSVPIYPVSEVATGLRQQPQAWIGRTVLIWGGDLRLGWPCTAGAGTARTAACRQGQVEWLLPARRPFFPTARTGWTSYPPAGGVWYGFGGLGRRRGLLVRRPAGVQVPAPGEPNGLLLQLAQVPVVGSLVPARLLERGAVYRVRLLGATRCASPPCPGGVLQ